MTGFSISFALSADISVAEKFRSGIYPAPTTKKLNFYGKNAQSTIDFFDICAII